MDKDHAHGFERIYKKKGNKKFKAADVEIIMV